MSSDSFDFDDDGLDELNQLEIAYATGLKLPPRTSVNASALTQRNLFGEPIVAAPPAAQKNLRPQHASTTRQGAFDAAKVKPVKVWGREMFAKHGWSKKNAAVARKAAGFKTKGKGKGKATEYNGWGDDDDESVLEDDDDEDDPKQSTFFVNTTYDPHAPPLPMKCEPDREAIKTWVYPVQADKPLRKYQYDIVYIALLNNTLVSLPTGLGKTFIAACVMLNFYRWFPRGKIVFLAPSRPLVRQQIIACHSATGIPQEHCVELTGSTTPKLRSIGWATKRVIYSTPQTVENDLRKGRVDPRDITCLVVDEAHRASGDYAYCGVVRYLMCRNPHFRILALTATPGSKGEAVQEVIDNLHICNIQVRTDQSFDIKQYIYHKSYDLTIMPLGPQLSSIRDRWAALMQPFIGPLAQARLLFETRPEYITAFGCNLARGKINSLPGGTGANARFYPMIKTLSYMSSAMEHLIIQSVTQFEEKLLDMQHMFKTLAAKPDFRKIVADVKALTARSGYVGHPKMERLRSMCWDHFKAAEHEIDPLTGQPRQTRVMVFCNYRAVVEEIVMCLNKHAPTIKATRFVGQAAAKGGKGMTQKDQNEAIRKFKDGVYNVLVASSIGEEGLDIGEIDLIVCYEANKSPIRMLQRVGRTGRARDGHIIVLMTEGREEKNWDKAKEQYDEVQNALISNRVFEVYADGERLVPSDIKPIVDKVSIEAKPLDLDGLLMSANDHRRALGMKERVPRPAKDVKRNIPKGAFDGFRTTGEQKKAQTPYSPGRALRERKQAALLTESEEQYMSTRWYPHGGQAISPNPLNLDKFPLERIGNANAHKFPRHGARHEMLQSILRTTASIDDSQPEALDRWHAETSEAYNPNYIEPWMPPARRTGQTPLRFRHEPLPLSEVDIPILSSAVLQDQRPPTSSPLLLTSPEWPDLPDLPNLSLESSFAAARAKSLTPRQMSPVVMPDSPPVAIERRPTPPPLQSAQFEPPPQRSTGAHIAPETVAEVQHYVSMDLYGVLSSDESDIEIVPESYQPPVPKRGNAISSAPPSPVPVAPTPPPQPRPPSSSSFSAMLDDNDLDCAILSDTALLQGAVVQKFGDHVDPAKLDSFDESSPIRIPGFAGARGIAVKKNATNVFSSGAPVATDPPRAPLNRLRRGIVRSRPDDLKSDDNDNDNSDPAEAPVTRVRKIKRPKMNIKTAARSNLFDVEAVNSSASGTEASSEEYESENSDDVRFVHDEEVEDSSSQAMFYRESLMTQPPEGFGQGKFGQRSRPDRRGAPFTPATPRSQPDDWSYDSFCARDDEEIEMESSSQPPGARV
ncbi:BZ3500_MvSof-1268-A1-R1_Chr3-1g05746 [Microbotryum saponariae]|uniref:ATP-dependent DNA helicase n=1 Tax=Microbotryum saponariae TaxID=289078 RepID=A0A2X0NH85_9BASI|nr:BZ3500_MvSof-1268-A1-R1_Chr3-1g05746 [Microbotryum saponariae]SDA04936.1 BZ3501_MvSof-1269-A2-R1_Chr3-1g05416 [Microbotryum saponariae]